MTRQEMKEFAQSQVTWYEKENKWIMDRIERINNRLKQTRKEDKEQKQFSQAYEGGKYAHLYEGNYQGDETRKLINERRRHQRELKKNAATIEHYKREVEKYTDPADKPQEATQEAPAAEADQQPTETENAPQAATQAAEGTDEKKEEDNTMSNTTTKPTATQEAAAILTINPAIFKGLHIKLGFDFQQPLTICRIPAPFTIKKAWKLAGADHDPATSTAAIIMRDTGNTWGIYRDMHMAPITADNLRDDYDDHMSYSLGRAHGYKTVFSSFYAKGSFHDLRKSPTCEAWIIAQRNDLLKPWTEPARDWTERQRDMAPGEHPRPCRVYYGNRRPVYLIDKSNYRLDARREDLQRRAAKLRAERQKAAADDATRATATRRYNDLLKAFNAAKQRVITALVNVDPLTLGPTTVTELETIGKAVGEYAYKGLSGAARDINQFEAAARDNRFTTPARYDAAYNEILENLAAILPKDAGTAKEAV